MLARLAGMGLPATARRPPAEPAGTPCVHAASEFQSEQHEAGIPPAKVTELVLVLEKLCFDSGASASLSSSAGLGRAKGSARSLRGWLEEMRHRSHSAQEADFSPDSEELRSSLPSSMDREGARRALRLLGSPARLRPRSAPSVLSERRRALRCTRRPEKPHASARGLATLSYDVLGRTDVQRASRDPRSEDSADEAWQSRGRAAASH